MTKDQFDKLAPGDIVGHTIDDYRAQHRVLRLAEGSIDPAWWVLFLDGSGKTEIFGVPENVELLERAPITRPINSLYD